MHKIGFIGLGNMGAPLCERLLLKNKVNIFDINKSNLNKMENLGGIVKHELKDICENDFIFLCLPTSEIVEKITIGDNGLINDLKKNVFVIDMTTIVCTDLSGKGKASIEGHLKSDDFFSVDKFPTASLTILDVKKKGLGQYQVNANITIKGMTQEIMFDAEIKEKTAKAKLVIDRTEFGIIYKSGNFFEELADKAIYDEFEMSIELKF